MSNALPKFKQLRNDLSESPKLYKLTEHIAVYRRWKFRNKSPLPLTDPRDAMTHTLYTVLYTDVDGQCDELVTETVTITTLNVHLSWQHLRLQPFQRYGWYPPLKYVTNRLTKDVLTKICPKN